MHRRSLLATAGLALARPALAQNFPSRQVELVVPYAAGGPTDRYARDTAAKLGELWGQTVVVNNKPGGAAAIGAAAVANARGDGHTLLLGSFGIVSNPILLTNLPYNPRDLAPLCRIALGGGFLFIHPSIPATNARELQAWGKANPGALKFGSSGNGSTPHIAAELFAWRAGIEMVHIPYRGTAPATTDLVAGHINAMVTEPSTLLLVREGKLRAVGTSSSRRNTLAPDIPTLQEQGFDMVVRTFYGFFSPASTPVELQERIAADMRRVAQTEAVRGMLEQDGLEPTATTPAEFRDYIDSESRFWTEVIRARNIRL